jgi:hypothetical protein
LHKNLHQYFKIGDMKDSSINFEPL